jgi:hypothetical protein
MVAWLMYMAKMGFPGIIGGLFCSTYTALMDRQISKIQVEFPQWLGTLKTTKTLGQAFFLDKKFGGGAIALRNLDEVPSINQQSSVSLAWMNLQNIQ